MDLDEGVAKKGTHANIESCDDDEFFEFKEVESVMNPSLDDSH